MITVHDNLAKARMIKTDRIKIAIKSTIQALHAQNIIPTKYQVNKQTNISYITLNKYYDEVLHECD